MEALFAVLTVGGLALGVYELGQAHLKRSQAKAGARAAAAALADGPNFKATARLLKSRRDAGRTAFSGLAVDTERLKLALVAPGPSVIDSYLEGRIERAALDEAIHYALLRQSLRAYLRRKLRQIESPTAADGTALTQTIARHSWSCSLIERPLRSVTLPFADVIEAEVIADGRSIAKTALSGRSTKGDQILRQIAERRMAVKSCVGVYLKILVNDMDEPLVLLDLCDSDRMPPQSAQDCLKEALQWYEILRVIIDQRSGESAASGGKPVALPTAAKVTGTPAGRAAEATKDLATALRAVSNAKT